MLGLRPPSGESMDLSGLDVSEFETTESIMVWAGTYNVNGKREKALQLSHWLKDGWDTRAPDIWVISLQEMIDLSATNVIKDAVADTMSRTACDEWIREFHRAFEYVSASRVGCFPPGSLPVLVAKEYMCGIAVVVYVTHFAPAMMLRRYQDPSSSSTEDFSGGEDSPSRQKKKKKFPTVEAVATARIPTGAVGGRLGNKGACAIRLRIDCTDVCVVGAHLSAHRSDVEARNADYDTIVTRDCFRRDRFGSVSGMLTSWISGPTPATNSSSSQQQLSNGGAASILHQQQTSAPNGAYHGDVKEEDGALTETFGVLDHDVVVFFGDLNYRIVKSAPDKEVAYLIKTDLTKLVGLDQLKTEMRSRRVFQHGFLEPPLNFAPTYKYLAGTTLYDHEATPEGERNASGKKVRCPAWCDRVLYRVRPRGPRAAEEGFSEKIYCVAYDRSSDRLCVSDHRPVFALLDLRVRNVDLAKRAQACARVAEQQSETLLQFDDAPTVLHKTMCPASGTELFGGGQPRAPPPPPPALPGRPGSGVPMPVGGLPLNPPHVLLSAGQASTVVTLSAAADQPFAFAQIPPWLRLEPSVGTATTRIRATAHLDQRWLAQLHDNDGKLGATVQLFLANKTFLVPVCLTAAPGWPNVGGLYASQHQQPPVLVGGGPPALPLRSSQGSTSPHQSPSFA